MNTETTNSKGIAVVTGASSGMGAVYADRLAKRGFGLILVARRGDRLEVLANKLNAQHGTEVQTVVADLSNAEDLARVERLITSNAQITMLVNNAGTATF